MGGFGLPADPERLLEGEGALAGFLGAAFLMDEALGEFSGKGLHRLIFFLHLSRNGGSRRVRSARADQQQGHGAGKKGRETHDDLLKKSV